MSLFVPQLLFNNLQQLLLLFSLLAMLLLNAWIEVIPLRSVVGNFQYQRRPPTSATPALKSSSSYQVLGSLSNRLDFESFHSSSVELNAVAIAFPVSDDSFGCKEASLCQFRIPKWRFCQSPVLFVPLHNDHVTETNNSFYLFSAI